MPSYYWDIGKMEYWNINLTRNQKAETMLFHFFYSFPIIPPFHSFQRSS